MKLSTLINAFGELGTSLQHGMAEASHERFLQFFEDPDEDGVYELKAKKLKLLNDLGLDVPNLVLRVLTSIITEEMEFELETPLHITEDTDVPDDIEVSLKSGELFKTHSTLKIRIKFKEVDPPEGLLLLQDKVNAALKHEI